MFSHVYWTPCDNSRIKVAKQLKIKYSNRKIVKPGDLLVIFPRKFTYIHKKVARHKYLGLVVGMRKKIRRRGGHYIKGRYNSLIVLSYQRKFVGSRVFGPLYREVRQRRSSYIYKKIFSRTSYFV